MSKPLTEDHQEMLAGAVAGNGAASEAIEAALARLAFLERKIDAAEALALEVHIYIDADGAMSDSGMSFILKDYREIVE
jgi:hypothetical protein